MTVVVGMLVALAAAVTGGSLGRSWRGPGLDRRRGGTAVELVGGRPWAARRRRRQASGTKDLVAVVVEAGALLRAGAQPAEAWATVLRVPACGPVPTVEQLLAVVSSGARRRRPVPGELVRVRAVVAAARVAHELGAPLATVLDEIATAVVADAEAEAELAAALSGPRASVRVLLGLPALGLLLGAALGADPVGVLVGGGLGTMSGALGVALVAAGWWWTRALLGRARRAASPP